MDRFAFPCGEIGIRRLTDTGYKENFLCKYSKLLKNTFVSSGIKLRSSDSTRNKRKIPAYLTQPERNHIYIQKSHTQKNGFMT